jgi:mycothiol synthase
MAQYRTYEPGMLPGIVEAFNASRKEVPFFTPDDVEGFEVEMLRDPDFDPASLFVALDGERIVGFSEAYVQRRRVEAGKLQGFVNPEVVPELRGQGIERELMSRTLARLRERGIKEALYWLHHRIPWRLALAKDCGFQYLRRFYAMERGFDKPLPDVHYPAGYSTERFLATEATHDFVVEWVGAKDAAFVDHFNAAPSEPESFWNYRDLKDEEVLYIFARTSGGAPAGVCMPAIDSSTGEKDAWVGILGVIPAHRRRGLGRALLADGLAWIKSRGAKRARLGTDAQNERSLPLYRSAGFEVVDETNTWNLKL